MSTSDNERSLLGRILDTPTQTAIDAVSRLIGPGDFYHPFHGSLWESITATADAGNPVTPGTVETTLRRLHPTARFSPTDLTDLRSIGSYTAGDASWYAAQVADAANRRRMLEAATKIRQLAEADHLELADIREQSRQALDDATAGRSASTTTPFRKVVDDVIADAEREDDEVTAIPTGWPDLDRFIGGMVAGRLIVVGARPAVGKSVVGTNLAARVAHRGRPVVIASAEMGTLEVGQRMVAAEAEVNTTKFNDRSLDEHDWSLIQGRYDQMASLPIDIHDEPSMTLASIRTAARETKRDRGDLGLLVVDYLQLLDTGSRTTNRAEAVGQLSRGLKILARELDVCVVAMAQINRESLRHGDGRPRMSDLRESGAIEADANQVILLHRADDDLPDVEFIVDKNRHGPKGVATLLLAGHYAKFRNAARPARPAWSPSSQAIS